MNLYRKLTKMETKEIFIYFFKMYACQIKIKKSLEKVDISNYPKIGMLSEMGLELVFLYNYFLVQLH